MIAIGQMGGAGPASVVLFELREEQSVLKIEFNLKIELSEGVAAHQVFLDGSSLFIRSARLVA